MDGKVASVIILLKNPNKAEMCPKCGTMPTLEVSGTRRQGVGRVSNSTPKIEKM